MPARVRGAVDSPGLARRAAGRIHHAQRQPAEATRDLLAAAVMLGAVDVRLARDTLVEAAVEAQINGQFAPDGATRADVARAAQALPLTAGMTATAGDLLLDADIQLQLRGLDAARPALYRAIDAARQGSRDSPQLLYWLALACEDATVLTDEARLHELSSRMEYAARQHGTTLTLALALCHVAVWDLLAEDGRRPPGRSVDEGPRSSRLREALGELGGEGEDLPVRPVVELDLADQATLAVGEDGRAAHRVALESPLPLQVGPARVPCLMNEGEAVVHGPGGIEEVPHRGRAHDGLLGRGQAQGHVRGAGCREAFQRRAGDDCEPLPPGSISHHRFFHSSGVAGHTSAAACARGRPAGQSGVPVTKL